MASNFPVSWQPPGDAPFGHEWWYLTGLEDDGTTAITTQIVKGDLVVADWSSAAYTTIVTTNGLTIDQATLCTRPETAIIPSRKGVVVTVPTGTTNAGWILVRTAPGNVQIMVPDAAGGGADTTFGDKLVIANGSYKVAESGALGDLSVAELSTLVGYALEENSSGAAALKWCYFSPGLFR